VRPYALRPYTPYTLSLRTVYNHDREGYTQRTSRDEEITEAPKEGD